MAAYTGFDYSTGLKYLNEGIDEIGKAQQRRSIADIGGQIDGTPEGYRRVGQALAAKGDMTAASQFLTLAEQAQAKAARNAVFAPTPVAGAGTGGRSVADIGTSDYYGKTAKAESGGDPNAKNPNSTATGVFQFLSGTWADLAKRRPELGLTPDGRTDPQQQSRAIRAFTEENAGVLKKAGVEPTDGNLYMAHFLGAGDAPNFIKAVQQDPSVPAVDLVNPRSAAANRTVFYRPDGTPKTAGEVYASMTRRFGSGSTAFAAAPASAAQGRSIAALPGDDPAKLEADAAAYESTNPEAARQFRERAAAARGGARVAQAPAQPGAPVSDVPAQGARPAQGFTPPGMPPMPANLRPDISDERLVAIGDDPRAKYLLEERRRWREQNDPDKRELIRLDIETKRRALDGKGYRSLTTPEERQAAGVDPSYTGPVQVDRDGKLSFPGKPSTEVKLDQRGQGKFEEELGKGQAKRWNDYIAEGDVAQGRIADIQTLRETSRRLGSQGSQANLKAAIGPFAESLGIKIEGLPDIQLYESITQRLAPTLRQPGSGSTSDIEFKGFQRAIGPLSNNPAAREMILDTFEAASRNDLARAEIATRLATGEIDRKQAEKELRALPNPLEAYRNFRKENPDLVGEAIKEAEVKSKLDRSPPVKVTDPDKARKLPSGTRIILPDGSPGVVP